MNDLFLGIIAAAVVVMALIQVAAVLVAARTARRVGEAMSRLEQDVKPIVANLQEVSAEARPLIANLQAISAEARPVMANLQTIAADAARATAVATAQIERAERAITDVSRRIDDTLSSLRSVILRPAREGAAIFHGIKAAWSAFGAPAPRSTVKRPASVEEEDALFIG